MNKKLTTQIIAKTARISNLSDIETSVKGSALHIGEQTVIDSFVKIKFTGGVGDIIIGDRCSINSGCVLYSGNGLNIGNNVNIAANCVFAPTNHSYKDKDVCIRDQGFMPSRGGITIEDNVWIGAGVIILDGAIIRTGCVVGALSLVRAGVLEKDSVYAGNPIKLLRMR